MTAETLLSAVLHACPLVTREAMMSKDRTPRVVIARWVAYRLMRDHGATVQAIANTFNRDHGTICHGLKKLPTNHPALLRARATLEHQPTLPCAGDVW